MQQLLRRLCFSKKLLPGYERFVMTWVGIWTACATSAVMLAQIFWIDQGASFEERQGPLAAALAAVFAWFWLRRRYTAYSSLFLAIGICAPVAMMISNVTGAQLLIGDLAALVLAIRSYSEGPQHA